MNNVVCYIYDSKRNIRGSLIETRSVNDFSNGDEVKISGNIGLNYTPESRWFVRKSITNLINPRLNNTGRALTLHSKKSDSTSDLQAGINPIILPPLENIPSSGENSVLIENILKSVRGATSGAIKDNLIKTIIDHNFKTGELIHIGGNLPPLTSSYGANDYYVRVNDSRSFYIYNSKTDAENNQHKIDNLIDQSSAQSA